MKKRRFVDGEVNHIYQRTISGFNIFYEIEDYLVYYTIFSMSSLKYKVDVYGICLMIDHIHSLCAFKDRSSFSRFMSYVSNVFVQ
jgi:REP element-mobilizing transposase RayT